jgi:hypothetical protein
MKALFTNIEYIKLALVMALNFGVCIAFFAILEQAITTLGYTNSPQVISTLGTSGTIFGIVGNILYSFILKKTKKYKLILVIGIFSLIKRRHSLLLDIASWFLVSFKWRKTLLLSSVLL